MKFEIGDYVIATIMIHGEPEYIKGLIQHIPQDTGDCFYISALEDDGLTDSLIAINPNSKDFLSIYRKGK